MDTTIENVNVEYTEKLQRQVNKYKKENKLQQNRIGNLSQKLKDEKTKVLQLEKTSEKVIKGKEYVERENDLLKQENQTLTDKLDKYTAEEQNKKDSGVHVGNLQKEITILTEENKKQEKEYLSQIDELKRKLKGVRRHLQGEQKANKKRINQIKKIDSLLSESHTKVNQLNEARSKLQKELREEKKKHIALKRKTYSKQEVEREQYKQQLYESEELGYLIVEDQTYFVPLSDKKPRKVEEGTYKSGTVCRAHFYPNKKVKIVRTYKDERDKEIGRLSVGERSRVSKARKRLSKTTKLGKGFFNAIHDKEILILSAKQLKSYKTLFNRYENIEVIDPYGSGYAQIYTKIDRADIVVVRTDGASHAITNYVKDNKGSGSVFLYNTTDMDTAYAIYNKAEELGSEKRELQ